MARMDVLEWRPHPQRHNSICVFSSAVGESSSLLTAIEHNANWAVAHGSTFSAFLSPMARPGVHRQWEKVLAAVRILERDECAWLLHLDADALVLDVSRDPMTILRRLVEEAEPASPAIFATCNSPLGRGTDCDASCCGRARRRTGCSVGLHDLGPASPYPCMINSGVFFVRNAPASHKLLAEWVAKQSEHPEVFGEQASLNELKSLRPDLIEIVGGQVMNSHSAFDGRAGATSDSLPPYSDTARIAYDIALRLTSGYLPGPFEDPRLNATAYARVALLSFGLPPGQELKQRLQEDVGACARDAAAFICHPFARPMHMKKRLAAIVAHDEDRRARLLKMLGEQRLPYRSAIEARNASARMDRDAWLAHAIKARTRRGGT